MAKSIRGGKRSGGGSTAKGELTLPNGSKAEFEGELKYYGKDKSITGTQRANLETWEKKRTTAKVEYSICYDDKGNQIGREKRGGKGSVHPDYNAYISDGVGTHNHPRSSDGLLAVHSHVRTENILQSQKTNRLEQVQVKVHIALQKERILIKAKQSNILKSVMQSLV